MTQGNANTQAIPVKVTHFEDIIDGYFPLQESLRQMLCRNGFASACVTLTHVPIMDIPGLAPDAPVPLRLTHGTAGIADRLDIIVTLDGLEVRLSGNGKWHWYSDDKTPESLLSPLTRLAEPAIVQGIGIVAGATQTQTFGQVAVQQDSNFAILQKQWPDRRDLSYVSLWARSPFSDGIHSRIDLPLAELFEISPHEFERILTQHQVSKLGPPIFTEVLILNDPPK